jgi:hypothetical protein
MDALLYREALWRFMQSVGVTVLLTVLHASEYTRESQTLVLGRNFLSFALQFAGANVSVR